MSDIQLKTDGTLGGTTLIVDGAEQTVDNKVVSISFYASAPYKSKYSGETVQGYVSCSYEYATDKKTVERKSIGSSETEYEGSIGEKMESSDAVVRFVGAQVDQKILTLVDTIISHCEKEKIPCPSKEILLNRSEASLQDKASDLGLKLDEVIKSEEITTETK